MSDEPVQVVRGDDPILRDDEVARLVDELLAGEPRLYALEDFTIAGRRRAASSSGGDDEADGDDDSGGEAAPVFRQIMTALESPPFMTSRRVVVVRDIGAAVADQASLLADYVAQPLDGVFLVLVYGGGRVVAALDKALKAAGVPVHGPSSEKTDDVLTHSLHEAELKLSADARQAVVAHLGDDAGRVPELVALLESTFGAGSSLDRDDVAPYLGESGTVAPYVLTNAIDAGDSATALDTLQRLLRATSARNPRPQHPLQVMGMLNRHYESLLRIDSPDVHGRADAARVLGIKEYPAGLRLAAAQRLGTRGLTEAIGHLAQADLDLRGGIAGRRAIPAETVVELLVARLAALSRRSGAGSSSRSRASSRRG
jgi:DNA polymerase-3 subunit delta